MHTDLPTRPWLLEPPCDGEDDQWLKEGAQRNKKFRFRKSKRKEHR
jgi:hypothetical protein